MPPSESYGATREQGDSGDRVRELGSGLSGTWNPLADPPSSPRERVRSAMTPLATREGRHGLRSKRIAVGARRAIVASTRKRCEAPRNPSESEADDQVLSRDRL